jgi:hypothetical protein
MEPFIEERASSVEMASRRGSKRSRFDMRLILDALEPRRALRPRRLHPSAAWRTQNKKLLLEEFEHRVLPTFTLGSAANYAVLYEGAGGHTLQITNVATNVTASGPSQGGGIGNIGVGGTGESAVGGPSILNGRIDFSAANKGQFSNNSPGNVITGGVNYNVSAVTSVLNTVNALNTTLGVLPGPSPTVSCRRPSNPGDPGDGRQPQLSDEFGDDQPL